MNAWNALAYGQPGSSIRPGRCWSCSGGGIAFGLALYLFNWDSRNRQGRLPNAIAVLAFVPYILSALFLG